MSYDEILEVDVALDAASGIWFPSAWHYERKNEGQKPTVQDVTITDVVLNKPLPESLFEMQDIKILPAGVAVNWLAKMVPPPAEGRLFWDGNEIVSQDEYIQNAFKNNDGGRNFSIIICFNVGVLALIYAIYAWKKYCKLKNEEEYH